MLCSGPLPPPPLYILPPIGNGLKVRTHFEGSSATTIKSMANFFVLFKRFRAKYLLLLSVMLKQTL